MICLNTISNRALNGLALVLVLASSICFRINAATVEPPPDPGYEVSVIASDVIAEVEVVAGGPFRAVALVKKTLKGDAPKVIELEGFNSFNWDTVHHGLQNGARCYMFLSKTERPDVFVPLTPAAPRFNVTPEGVMTAFGDPPVRFPVKSAALEQGLQLLVEKNASGKIPEGAYTYLRGLWDQGEIEARYLAVEMSGALRDERALPILLEASKDKLLKLRLRSIEALGKVGTPNALGALRSLLKDDKKSVAREAARVLAQLHDADSITAMLEWVRKNSAATKSATAGSTQLDSDQLKTEAAGLEAIALAKSTGMLVDAPQISRALLDIARMPNVKLAEEAIDASMAVAPVESIPTLIELAQDRLYDHRERAFSALKRIALKPVRDIDEFQLWWGSASATFNEDKRREIAEAAGRNMARAEEYEERHKALDILRSMPGGIGVVTSAPFLLNVKASNNFGEDDLAAWSSPLAVPFLIERLGRDSATTRKSALDALVSLCTKNPRLASVLWPLMRAQLSERDSGIRRSAQAAASAFSKADGMNALLDAAMARGVYEPQDCGKFIYSITARTMGFSINEPQPDQNAARRHFRGWWENAGAHFHAFSISTPVNPFAIFPGESAKIRVLESADDSARATKLEALSLAENSDISEAAFGVLMTERNADDAFWKKMMDQKRSRDRARGLVGSIGSNALVAELAKRIGGKSDAETPLTRALALLSLGASGEAVNTNGAGPKAVVDWLKSSDLAANHPMKRLGVLCLGLANKEPNGLAYLTEIVDAALKADAPDPDATTKVDEQNGPYALLRSAVIALCARDDGNAVLLRVLNEAQEGRFRETAARALSQRRDRAAIPGIVKALEKSDRYTWMDLTHTLVPLLNADEGSILCDMLDSSKNTTRAAAVWIATRRPELGNDAQTRAKFIAVLNDDSNLVRYYGAEALGKRKAKAATDSLVKLLDDSDDEVKAAAAEALGEIGDKDACVLVSKTAQNQYRVDARWMKALALSGNEKWMTDIMKLANSNLYMEQRAGLEALSSSEADGAKERLLKAFRSDDEVFQTVANDLLAERGDASLALIKDDLVSKDKAARARAFHFLTRLKSPAAKAALNDGLKTEEDPGIKALIEWGIARSK